MNAFEQAVYDCMNATDELYQRTTNPLHKAMLLNFWRHVHLEGSAQFKEITSETMMSDNPVYRITWGDNPLVVEGRQGVYDFYSSIDEVVLWNSDDCLAVADWGVCDELTFHRVAKGADLAPLGYEAKNPDGLYHVTSRQAFIWPYDDRARLAGEHLYEDPTSLEFEEIDPADAITPARVREIHKERLAVLEDRFGPEYWVYKG